MNIQELIKHIEKLPCTEGPIADTVTVNKEWILESLKSLDELKEVEIPQFIAEYIKIKKKDNFHVYDAMRIIEDYPDKRVSEWFYDNNTETFINSWMYGYKIKQKRYTVKIIETDQILSNFDNNLKFTTNHYDNFKESYEFTMHDLDSHNMSYVFDNKGFKVEEVK